MNNGSWIVDLRKSHGSGWQGTLPICFCLERLSSQAHRRGGLEVASLLFDGQEWKVLQMTGQGGTGGW